MLQEIFTDFLIEPATDEASPWKSNDSSAPGFEAQHDVLKK